MTYPAGVTPHYSLKVYNNAGDEADSFLNFRLNIAGTDTASNMYEIDSAMHNLQTQITATKGVKTIEAIYSITDDRYEADATGLIDSYDANTILLLKVDVTNSGIGTTRLYLSNLSLSGEKVLQKIDASGSNINLAAGDIALNKYYYFVYASATNTWVLLGSQTSDADVLFTDITTNNVSTTKHGFAPKAVAPPSSGDMNVFGIENGETAISNKVLFDSTNPASLGSVSSGVSTKAARRDHVHALPAIDTLSSSTDITTLNVSTSAHGLAPKAVAPASGVLNVYGIANGETAITNKTLFDSTNPANVGTASPGTSLLAARRDHVHAIADATTSTKGAASFDTLDFLVASGVVSIGEASVSKRGLVPAVQTPSSGYVKLVGVSSGGTVNTNYDIFGTSAILPQPVGTALSAGTALTAARVDHVHTYDFLLLQIFS